MRCGRLWSTTVASPAAGFKRQTPIGQHICDFVSFPLRTVIDVVPADETDVAAQARAMKRAWLAERDYTIVSLSVAEVETDVAGVLDRLDQAVGEKP